MWLDQEWDAATSGGVVKGNISIQGDASAPKKKRKVIHDSDGSVTRKKASDGCKKKSKKGKKR